MKKRIFIFLEFLIGGIIMGVIEDFILIKLASNQIFTFHIFLNVLLITIPFAFFGEYVIDRIDFLKIFNLSKKYQKIEVFSEFLIFGILLGVVEDLTAFYFAVGEPITLRVFFVAIIVALPFAFIGEFLIDRIDLPLSFSQRKIIFKNN